MQYKSVLQVLYDAPFTIKLVVRHQLDAATLIASVKNWIDHKEKHVFIEDDSSQISEHERSRRSHTYIDFGRVITFTVFELDTLGLVTPSGKALQ